MNETLVILIGNSDDKLSQKEWSQYAMDVSLLAHNWAKAIHFEGGSASGSEWQNACWVVEWDTADLANLNTELSQLAAHYRQDSIAVITGGTTRFVRP